MTQTTTLLPKIQLFFSFLILITLNHFALQAQINIQSNATDLKVCGASNALNIILTPETESNTPIRININLPEGIEYQDNSLNILQSPSNLTLQITNILQAGTNLQLEVTSSNGTWANGEELDFILQRTANCTAIDFAQIGGTFADEITLSQNETILANQNANYGIQFASLSIFQPAPVAGDSGQKIFRNITLNNGGFACADDVTYFIVVEQGLQVEAIRFGLFNIPLTFSGDTVFAELNDVLLGVGNGDTCFDDGESIELIEELRTFSCNTLLIETQHNVRWGCKDDFCNPFSGTTGNVVIIGGTDESQIRIETLQYNTPGTCANGQGEFRIINDGTSNENDPGYIINLLANIEWNFSNETAPCPRAAGVIQNITVNGHPYNQGNYNSGQYRINLAANQNPDLGVTDADGDGFYDDLLPNDTLQIRYEIDFDCFEACFCDVGVLTDISSIFYNDFCGANVYEQDIESNFTIERSYQIPSASFPNDIEVGTIATLEICSNIDQNLNCPSDQSTLFAYLPDSLVLSPDLPNAYLTDGTPLTAIIENDTLKVTGIEGISVNCINVDLIWTGEVNPESYSFSFDLLYECEAGCDCFEAIDCGTFSRTPTLDEIPDTCVNILQIATSLERQTLGWKDFQLTQSVNPLEEDINLQFALACDTIHYQSQTFVEENIENLTSIRFRLSYAGQIEGEDLLNWFVGNIRWYDSTQGQSFDCVLPHSLLQGQILEGESLAIDLGIDELFGICEWDAAAFSQGDSLIFIGDFEVLEGGLNNDFVINPAVTFSFYARDTSDLAFKLQCGSSNASNLQMYQNQSLLKDSTYAVEACTAQTLEIAWSNDIDNLENGPITLDFFPNEIRPDLRFDSVVFQFPKALQYVEGSARINYFPNPIGEYFIGTPTIQESADALQYTFVNQGDWVVGDRLNFLKDTTGNETINGYFALDFWADCTGGNKIEATLYAQTNIYSPNPDCRSQIVLHKTYPLSYDKPQIGANLITTNLDGVAGQVTAQLEYCNNSGQMNMSNAFLLFEPNTDPITVISSNIGTLITLEDGLQLLQLGNLPPLQCLDIELQLSYNNCVEAALLKTFFSWDCLNYPNNIDQVRCDKALRSIQITPKEAEVQLDVQVPAEAIQLCDTMYYDFTINSAQLANITQPILLLDLPPLQGLVLTNSNTIEYPLGTPPRAFTAAINGNQLLIDVGLADSENEPSGQVTSLGINGFALSSNADERKARIRLGFTTDCNFVAGSNIRASIFANLPCGAPAVGSGFSQILPPVLIQGIDNSYQTELEVNASTLEVCQSNTTVEIKIFNANNQIINESDAHCYLFLPEGLNYSDGSFQAIAGNVETPTISSNPTVNQLDFNLTYGESVEDSIVFQIEVFADQNFVCQGESLEIIAQTVELQNTNCSTTNEECNLATQTNEGTGFFEIPLNNAAISLQSATASIDCASNDNQFELNVTLQNEGNQLSSNIFTVSIYLDTNFNGELDEEDLFFDNLLYDTSIDINETVSFSSFFGAEEVLGFPLIVFLETEGNCESCANLPLLIESIEALNNTLEVGAELICLNDAYQLVVTIEGGLPPYSISGTVESSTSDPIFQSDTLALDSLYSITVADAQGCFRQLLGLVECTTLPIELLSFEGKAQDNGNYLQWFTASETNNDFYTLEHSVDGRTFTKIATTEGAGTSLTPQTYDFLDRFAPIGVSYYRLSQTDFDRTTRYLGTISLRRQQTPIQSFRIQRIYPIPTSDILFIEFDNPSANDLELELVNTLGQTVRRQHIGGAINKLEFDCSGLEKGLYLLRIGGVWEKVMVR